MKSIKKLNIGDVVFVHAPINPEQDRYADEFYYDRMGIVVITGYMPTKYIRVGFDEDDMNSNQGRLYHAGEITKIGEL